MSTTEVTSKAVHDKLADVTTCCICDETYRDPKILPCVHTFCLTCLQRTGTQIDKKPGDSVPCPLCRQEFTVPEEGFAALKKNFFMERLVEIASSSRQGASSVCSKHEHEALSLYCSDCGEVLCLVCLRESHQNHRLSDLGSTADVFRSQIKSDVGTARRCMSDALKKRERLAQKKTAFLNRIEGFEREVHQVASDLKALLDQHADSMLQNLGLLKQKRITEIEIEEKELEKHMGSLENFEKCCAELTSDDRHDSLICKVGRELKEQIAELELLNKSIIEHQLRSFEVNFQKTVGLLTPLNAFLKGSGNLIGTVEAARKTRIELGPIHRQWVEENRAKIDYSMNAELVTTMGAQNAAEAEGISGITVTGNKIFVLNNKNPCVSLYDCGTFNCVTKMNLKGFVSDVDLRHCASVNGSVFIVNGSTREVLLIDQNLVLIKWSTKDDWGRLSVSPTSTIVATCYETGALREYALQGTLLQEIKLCKSILHPLHAIKLNDGHFVVSHGGFKDDLNRVCVVNYSGGLTKSFGDSRGSSIKQLDVPTCLAVDEDGKILVLDRNNSRVLLLGPTLEFERELLTKANGLRNPVAMHFDERTGRLYVADNEWEKSRWSNGKVFVFNVK